MRRLAPSTTRFPTSRGGIGMALGFAYIHDAQGVR